MSAPKNSNALINGLKDILPDLNDKIYEQLLEHVNWDIQSAVDEYFLHETLYQKPREVVHDSSGSIRRMVAMYSFTSGKPGEVSIQKDEVVMMHNHSSDGWALVEKTVEAGKFGTVPFSYLKQSDPPPPPPSSSSSSSSSPSSPSSSSSPSSPSSSSPSSPSAVNLLSTKRSYIPNVNTGNVFGSNGLDLLKSKDYAGGCQTLFIDFEITEGIIKCEIQYERNIGVATKTIINKFHAGIDSKNAYSMMQYGPLFTLTGLFDRSADPRWMDERPEPSSDEDEPLMLNVAVEVNIPERIICFFVNGTKMPFAVNKVPSVPLYIHISPYGEEKYKVTTLAKLTSATPSNVKPQYFAWQ